jgi:hypothetical protein
MNNLEIDDRPPTSTEVAEAIILIAKELSNSNPSTVRSNLMLRDSSSINAVLSTIALIVHLGKEMDAALEREKQINEDLKNN